jgi:hypothetical protein
MEVIDEIISELANTNNSLNPALFKALVLARQIHNSEFEMWANSELNGYTDKNILPSYRKIKATIRGTFINLNVKYNNSQVPLLDFDSETETALTTMFLYQSVSTLEKIRDTADKSLLIQPFPPQIVSVIENNWKAAGNPFLQLVQCQQSVNALVTNEIISQVRTKLFDFLIKYNQNKGISTDISIIKKKEEIIQYMSQTIITTTGDGNVINTGNHVTQHNQISIGVKNKKELSEYLEGIGVAEEDRNELLTIVETELPDQSTGRFGNKVNQWITKMLSKALEGTWNIAKETAVSVLSDAVKKYYGID